MRRLLHSVLLKMLYKGWEDIRYSLFVIRCAYAVGGEVAASAAASDTEPRDVAALCHDRALELPWLLRYVIGYSHA